MCYAHLDSMFICHYTTYSLASVTPIGRIFTTCSFESIKSDHVDTNITIYWELYKRVFKTNTLNNHVSSTCRKIKLNNAINIKEEIHDFHNRLLV